MGPVFLLFVIIIAISSFVGALVYRRQEKAGKKDPFAWALGSFIITIAVLVTGLYILLANMFPFNIK